jgi:hypothetical protein
MVHASPTFKRLLYVADFLGQGEGCVVLAEAIAATTESGEEYKVIRLIA